MGVVGTSAGGLSTKDEVLVKEYLPVGKEIMHGRVKGESIGYLTDNDLATVKANMVKGSSIMNGIVQGTHQPNIFFSFHNVDLVENPEHGGDSESHNFTLSQSGYCMFYIWTDSLTWQLSIPGVGTYKLQPPDYGGQQQRVIGPVYIKPNTTINLTYWRQRRDGFAYAVGVKI